MTSFGRYTRMLLLVATMVGLCPLIARCQDRDALRHIVQDECLPHWRATQDPAPCVALNVQAKDSVVQGFAILHDRKGGAHFLLIAMQSISGLESPLLLRGDSVNFLAAAWRARDRVSGNIGRVPPRTAIGLAVNPMRARSQDQFHIHIECLRPDVIDALHAAQGTLSEDWVPIKLIGARYYARRMRGAELTTNPIQTLARYLPEAHTAVGDYTLAVGGMEYAEGPGFAELVSLESAGELLLDSTCAAAQ